MLAIDLSLASLAFGIRKSRERGFNNIEFAQADILEIADLERRFDVIESVGVLHHLSDPIKGWRVLCGLLNDGGYMHIGLYSEIARASVVDVRDLISKHGYRSSDQDIRRLRQHIISLPPQDKNKLLLLYKDFFSTSECRDLLFHVQEHRFTLPQLATALDELGLEFLGFELADPVMLRAYKTRYPQDPSSTSLSFWHQYEVENPHTFATMYKFWVRKR